MKLRIEAAFRHLLGEPITDKWRYAGCQKFEFGMRRAAKNHSGDEITLADFGLVVSCDWRIQGPGGGVVSSDDFAEDHRSDSRAKPFYHLLHTAPPVVEGIEADDDGALRVRLSQGYTLKVAPTLDIEPHDEQWRLMSRTREQGRVVLWGEGLEEGLPSGP